MASFIIVALLLAGAVVGAVINGTQRVDEDGFPVRDEDLS